jgi:pilus assembly protein CpaE
MFLRPLQLDTVPAHIRLVTDDAELEKRLRRELLADRRLDIQTVGRAAAASLKSKGFKADADPLVVDVGSATASELAALETIIVNSRNGAPVIVISDDLGGETVRRLLQLQVADWLPRQVNLSELQNACERALRARDTNPNTASARCYAFYPAQGGVGNTTLAASAAFLLANKKQKRRSVCLVDLDLQSGSLAEYLDLTPNIQLDDIVNAPDRLDSHLLEVLISRHSSGVALLAAPNALTGFDKVRPELIARMLDLAAAKFDSVVIDLPRVWLPWSESILRGTDHFFIVTELSVPGLRQARHTADALQNRFGVSLKGRIIVNKVRWLRTHGMKKSDAYEILGERLAGFVCDAGAIVTEAHNRGMALSELKRSNRLERDFAAILPASPTGD